MTAEPHDALAQLLIDAYLAAFGREAGAENFWAWDVLDTLVGRRPDIAWPILLRLVQRMPEEGLGDLAAGPIEDFLSQHGPRAIDAVEAEAATNPRLRRALSMVWRLGMTDDVWRRVQSLADPWPDGEEPEDPSSRRRLELALDGAPPTPGGDEAARRGLIAAAREAKPDGQEPWSTPVYLELRLETGDRPLPAPSAEVLLEVIGTLAEGGILADASLVREARVFDVRSPSVNYRLSLHRMPAEQVATIDDVRTIAEQDADPAMRAFIDELGIDWPPVPPS